MNKCGCGCKAVLSLNTRPNSVIQIKDRDEPFLNMNTKDKGVDATINGVNTLTLTATGGLELIQDGDVATISGSQLQEAISGVSSDLAQEILDRKSADNNLQNQINSISGDLSNYRTASDQDVIDNAQNTVINSKQDKLNTAQLNAVNSGITSSKVNSYDSHIANTVIHVTQQDKTNWNNKQNALTQTQLEAVNSGITSSGVSQITTNKNNIASEVTNRQNADNGLQSQIDAIVASSDVTDIVGTYAQLQAYDTSTLPPNSIIKVLQDESQNDETTYYRWVINGGVGSWVLIGEEGPYYTKSQADERFATSAQGAKADTALQPSALNGYATETWVGQQGFLTSTALNGYATEQWVENKGYITSSALTNYVRTDNAKFVALNVQYKDTLVPSEDLDLSTITVDKGEATYGFSYDSVSESLKSESSGIDEAYSYGKITVNVPSDTTLTVYFRQDSETNYDFGEISTLDSYLTYEPYEDYDNVLWSGREYGDYSSSVTFNLTAGEHFFTFKYLKDGSVAEGSDSFYITKITVGSYGEKKLVDYNTQQEITLFVKKSDISTSVDSLSTNDEVVGSKLFYDTCGDIETLINAL